MKRKLAVVAVALIALASWYLISSHGPPEPVYEGKPLSEWLAVLLDDESSEGAKAAATTVWAGLGKEAMPWLIWSAEKNDPEGSLDQSQAVDSFVDGVLSMENWRRNLGAARGARLQVALVGLQAAGLKAEAEFRPFAQKLKAQKTETGRWQLSVLQPASTPYFLDLASDPSPDERVEAIRLLVFSDFAPLPVDPGLPGKVLETLLKALDDPVAGVRRTAALYLSVCSLRHPTSAEWARFAAQEPAGRYPHLSQEELERTQRADRVWTRIDNALKTKMIARLISAIDDPDPEIRRSCTGALGNWGGEAADAIPKLVGILSEPVESRGELQISAASTLGKIGRSSELVVEPLRGLLENEKADVRMAAAEALARLGVKDDEVKRELIAQFNPKKENTTRKICRVLNALIEIGDHAVDDAWPALIKAVAERARNVHVGDFIPVFRELAKSRLPQVIELLSHPQRRVRELAARALPEDDPQVKAAMKRIEGNQTAESGGGRRRKTPAIAPETGRSEPTAAPPAPSKE